jgi:LemA protein
MPSTIVDSAIFGNIFSTDAMRAVWSDENRTQKYLDVEAALARAEAEAGLTAALRGLTVAVEAYPQLQASGGFRDLQGQLGQIEEAVQNARRYYNAVVRELNTRIMQFPSNVVAGAFGFQPREFFEAAEVEREAPKVSF